MRASARDTIGAARRSGIGRDAAARTYLPACSTSESPRAAKINSVIYLPSNVIYPDFERRCINQRERNLEHVEYNITAHTRALFIRTILKKRERTFLF